ncbi:MAG: GtrA family protein [Christensenellales bacterium]|jgi:putative flippase GtrA
MQEKIEALWKRYRQFIRFCIVGATNTIITLLVYQGLLMLSVPYLIASPVGYACGIVNGYLWSTAVVFRKRRDLRNLAKFVAVNLFVLGLNTGLMYLWVDVLSLHKLLAQCITLLFTIPCNFLFNKLWTFRG